MGLGEIRLGEMGLGEMGLGEMGQNRINTLFSTIECARILTLLRSTEAFRNAQNLRTASKLKKHRLVCVLYLWTVGRLVFDFWCYIL